MESVSGRLSRFLDNQEQQVMGFVLDCGQEVRFWVTPANVLAIKDTVTVGSLVEIQGDFRRERAGEEYMLAALITNLDSKRTVSVLAPVHLGKPGMPLHATPTKPASLAHLKIVDGECSRAPDSSTGQNRDILDLYLQKIASQPRRPDSARNQKLSRHMFPLPPATRNDAARGIERAYDGFQRIQAILAYLHIMKRQVPGISQFLNEAKHTYEQALRRYEEQDFEGAREFAGASSGLSLVVEIIISRTLRSDTTYPSSVPPPPEHFSASGDADSGGVQENLDEVETLLSRIHWLMENGTLPLEDRTQVRRIASWSETLYGQARRMYGSGSQEDATELLQAAHAAAHSAEHVCRKWYVSHADVPRNDAAERAH